jgi:hypothetical protein
VTFVGGQLGQLAFLNNINDPWTAYTPTFRFAGGALFVGNGSVAGRFKQIGKTCTFRARLVFGSTTSFSTGQMLVSVPVAAPSAVDLEGLSGVLAVGAGPSYYAVAALLAATTEVTLIASGGVITATAPSTWAAGNWVSLRGTYETA